MEMKHNIKSILLEIDVPYTVEGKADTVSGFSSLEEASEHDLSFCSFNGKDAVLKISKSYAAVILCNLGLRGAVHPKASQSLIFVGNARLVFIRIVNYVQTQANASRTSTYSLISKTAKIGSNCHIGDFAIIGDNCSIGDNTVIHDRVSLQNCKIGNNCAIHSSVIIGCDGFAYERLENGKLEKFPHLKGVVIGNNVEICSNCQIARGSLSDTEIGDGTKLDGYVYVAHNAKVGKDCLLAGGAIVGGTARIGDQCWLGLHCSIKQKVRVGNNVIIGAGAVVIDDVADGDIVAGVPARTIRHKVTTDKVFMMAGQKK